MTVSTLLSLPLGIQIALGSGCAAYFVAYSGIRDRHRTIDIAFITLVFSLASSATFALTSSWGWIEKGFVAFICPVVIALIWRKWGRNALRALLRASNISWSDDDPSALATLSSNSRFRVSQVAVLLDDGTWLSCDDTRQFNDAPYGPCLFGPNGDVALYLTHEEPPGEEARDMQTTRNPDYGDRITYIPAARIRRITLRHMKPT